MDERKIDQAINEVGRYKIDVAALQETKWFVEVFYEVAGSFVLSSGRPEGDMRQQQEGGAAVLSGSAITVWRNGGEMLVCSCTERWNAKKRIFLACVLSVLLHGNEC